jgi:hypothetical protein
MKFCIFFFLFFIAKSVTAQYNQLLLKKNGIAVKRFSEGSVISIETVNGMKYTGTIYLIQKDSIYFHDSRIHINQVAAVYKKAGRRSGAVIPMDKEAFLYANLGIGIFTAGLSMSGVQPFTAFLTGAGLVYIPILIHNICRVAGNGNKKMQIGEKYTLQVMDLYEPEKVPVHYH